MEWFPFSSHPASDRKTEELGFHPSLCAHVCFYNLRIVVCVVGKRPHVLARAWKQFFWELCVLAFPLLGILGKMPTHPFNNVVASQVHTPNGNQRETPLKMAA